MIDKAFFVWAGGTKFSIPEIRGNLKPLPDGRIIVNEYLQIPAHPEVFAAGDSAAVKDSSGNYIRKAVNFAWFGGKHAGKNISRLAGSKKLRPFKPVDPGWIIPLHEKAVGRLFGFIRAKGRLPLRLHYLLCGIRNYGKNRLAFVKTAITLMKEQFMKKTIKTAVFGTDRDPNIGLLLLRVFTGIAMMTHGYTKLFGGLEGFTRTVEKIGFPLPALFAFMAAFSEFAGALFIASGFMTKVWAFFLGFTMLVAWLTSKSELALLYLAVCVMFMLKGGGKYSADYLISRE